MEKRCNLIRTPSVDELLKNNQLEVSRVMSSNMTEEEKEYLKDLSFSLDEELEMIEQIQNELIIYLEKQGLSVCDYLK